MNVVKPFIFYENKNFIIFLKVGEHANRPMWGENCFDT